MNTQELIDSLSAEQVAAVYAIRDSILAQHATADQAFVTLNQQIVADKEAAEAAKNTLTTEKETLTEQLATANATINTLTTELAEKTTLANAQATAITNLENNLDSANDLLTAKTDELAETITELQSQISSLEAERIVLNTKITFLESIRTYDPNQIKSKAFYDRITKEEMNDVAVLALSGDATAAAIYAKFNDYVKNDWQVLLDDPEVVGGTQYLTYTGTFKEGRAAQITRPASREEAYFAP